MGSIGSCEVTSVGSPWAGSGGWLLSCFLLIASDATPTDILAALKRKGIKASLALVNSIKYKNPTRTVSLAQIQAAKAFSAKMRGLDNARAALNAYGRLSDSK